MSVTSDSAIKLKFGTWGVILGAGAAMMVNWLVLRIDA